MTLTWLVSRDNRERHLEANSVIKNCDRPNLSDIDIDSGRAACSVLEFELLSLYALLFNNNLCICALLVVWWLGIMNYHERSNVYLKPFCIYRMLCNFCVFAFAIKLFYLQYITKH